MCVNLLFSYFFLTNKRKIDPQKILRLNQIFCYSRKKQLKAEQSQYLEKRTAEILHQNN